MKMMQSRLISSVFLFSLCLIVPLAQATDFRYCDNKGNYDVKVKGVEISPNPVTRGQPATFTISATSGETISGGKLNIDVSYFGFHVHSESHDLCEETSCPVGDGEFKISHTQVLPGYTPPGSYTLTMKLNGDKKQQLTCIEFNFNIGFASSVADA